MTALGDGTRVTVRQPTPPRVRAGTPVGPRSVVVPVRGPAGPPGATGGSSDDHHQTTPAAQWVVTHNLGTYPTPVILLDDAPTTPVWTDIEHLSNTQLVLTFPSPVTGWAHTH